jgi:hypothetical protein
MRLHVILACVLIACGSEPAGSPPPGGSSSGVLLNDAGMPIGEDGAVLKLPTIEVNIMYVHGVKSCELARVAAHYSLKSLDDEVLGAAEERIAAYKAEHPGIDVVFRTRRANLYTAKRSAKIPTGANPINMDDWTLDAAAGCGARVQGDPCTSAYEWRHRLAQEIKDKFPPEAKNIILVGHSTGARTAFEVAANVGPRGVDEQDWGVRDRIAGVVSVHGMVDSIGTNKYNVAGPVSFETLCKNSDPVAGFGGGCANGNGWCEYAARVSGFDAADWVATNKSAMMLIGSASCSPALWRGVSDGSLPIDAQGSPKAVGIELAPQTDGTFRPAHGERYGSFCHSTLDSISKPEHPEAVTAAAKKILDWLFVAAPRTVAAGTHAVPSLGRNQASSVLPLNLQCPADWTDDTVTTGSAGPGIDVAGICHHPGVTDGDTHAIEKGELSLTDLPNCNGSLKWTQKHAGGNHAATIHWKTRGLRATAPELIGSFEVQKP